MCIAPEHNGVAKRKNRHLLEVTTNDSPSDRNECSKTILNKWGIDVGLLDKPGAIKKIGRKRSNEVLCPSAPLFPIPPKVFMRTCFVHIPKQQEDKLDPKATKCTFLGYPSFQKGNKCHLPGKNGRVFVTIHMTVHEDTSFYLTKSKQQTHE